MFLGGGGLHGLRNERRQLLAVELAVALQPTAFREFLQFRHGHRVDIGLLGGGAGRSRSHSGWRSHSAGTGRRVTWLLHAKVPWEDLQEFGFLHLLRAWDADRFGQVLQRRHDVRRDVNRRIHHDCLAVGRAVREVLALDLLRGDDQDTPHNVVRAGLAVRNLHSGFGEERKGKGTKCGVRGAVFASFSLHTKF